MGERTTRKPQSAIHAVVSASGLCHAPVELLIYRDGVLEVAQIFSTSTAKGIGMMLLAKANAIERVEAS